MLSNNFVPNTSLVFSVKPMEQQLSQATSDNAKAIRDAFGFGTKLVDFAQSNKQADLMEKNDREKQSVQEQLQADMNELAELKQQLAALEGGV